MSIRPARCGVSQSPPAAQARVIAISPIGMLM